jgi:putative inorganic carbon (HCO3(-)) transporter
MLLVAPLFALPSPWPLIPLCMVPLVWLAIRFAGGEPLVLTPLNIPILVIAIMLLVSTWATFDLKISIGYISGAVLGLAAFFTTARYAGTPKGWWLCIFFFVGFNLILAIVVFCMIQWSQVQLKFDLLTRITSQLGIPLISIPKISELPTTNTIPGFILGILPIQIVFTTSVLLHRKRWSEYFGQKRTILIFILLLVLTVISSVALLLSQSRTGYISFAGACIIILLVGLTPRRRWFLLTGMVIVVLLIIALWKMGFLTSLQENLQNIMSSNFGYSLDSLQMRNVIWSRAIYGIQDFPFTGMGMATFGHVTSILYPSFHFNPNEVTSNAHNTFLQVALDLGIPGLAAFLGVQFGSFWLLLKSWNIVSKLQTCSNANQGFPPQGSLSFLARPILLGLGGAFFANVIFGLFESVSLGVYILIWILTGLIVGYNKQIQISWLHEVSITTFVNNMKDRKN